MRSAIEEKPMKVEQKKNRRADKNCIAEIESLWAWIKFARFASASASIRASRWECKTDQRRRWIATTTDEWMKAKTRNKMPKMISVCDKRIVESTKKSVETNSCNKWKCCVCGKTTYFRGFRSMLSPLQQRLTYTHSITTLFDCAASNRGHAHNATQSTLTHNK